VSTARKPAVKKTVKKRWTPRMVSRLMIRKARKRRRTQASGLEKQVLGWLGNAEIAHRKQYPIGRCHVDILIEPDLVIEINACYWHGHERCQPPSAAAARQGQEEIQVLATAKVRMRKLNKSIRMIQTKFAGAEPLGLSGGR
jgi:G:T-mismatch repair DNA endonuclease (very short patch repair protein)